MIINKTKKSIISQEKRICKSLFSKFKGLMFTKKARCLVFVNQHEIPTPIHMMFVFYPIDVLWLNKSSIVVHKQTLKPFEFSGRIDAKYVIELPEGSAKSVSVGDRIDF